MRDAINQTGRQMWYSITQQLDYNDGQDSMHCIKPSAPGKGRYGVRRTNPSVHSLQACSREEMLSLQQLMTHLIDDAFDPASSLLNPAQAAAFIIHLIPP